MSKEYVCDCLMNIGLDRKYLVGLYVLTNKITVEEYIHYFSEYKYTKKILLMYLIYTKTQINTRKLKLLVQEPDYVLLETGEYNQALKEFTEISNQYDYKNDTLFEEDNQYNQTKKLFEVIFNHEKLLLEKLKIGKGFGEYAIEWLNNIQYSSEVLIINDFFNTQLNIFAVFRYIDSYYLTKKGRRNYLYLLHLYLKNLSPNQEGKYQEQNLRVNEDMFEYLDVQKFKEKNISLIINKKLSKFVMENKYYSWDLLLINKLNLSDDEYIENYVAHKKYLGKGKEKKIYLNLAIKYGLNNISKKKLSSLVKEYGNLYLFRLSNRNSKKLPYMLKVIVSDKILEYNNLNREIYMQIKGYEYIGTIEEHLERREYNE